jgi:hypothetical protein
MFGPSLTCETSVVLTARYCQLLRPLLTSPQCSRHQETSPGKSISLLPIPAVSTGRSLLATDFVKLCSLIHFCQPRYTVSVRQYRSLQSRFLQCLLHSKPPCDLLTGFTNSPVRDLHPLEYSRYLIYLCPCWAHTKCIINGGARFKFVVLVFKQRLVSWDSVV